eukprot:5710645-Lingulodinium_polyedra.AAC.1
MPQQGKELSEQVNAAMISLDAFWVELGVAKKNEEQQPGTQDSTQRDGGGAAQATMEVDGDEVAKLIE